MGPGGVQRTTRIHRRTDGGPATSRLRNAAAALGLEGVQIRYRAGASWQARGDAWKAASLLAGGAMRAFTETAEESSVRRRSAQGEHYDRLGG